MDGFGADQHKRNDADLGPLIDPIVDGAALNEHVTGFEHSNHAIVKFHVNLTRDHNRIVDGVCSVVSRGDAWLIAHHAKNSAIVNGGFEGGLGGVLKSIVVDWKALRGPHHC